MTEAEVIIEFLEGLRYKTRIYQFDLHVAMNSDIKLVLRFSNGSTLEWVSDIETLQAVKEYILKG